MSGFVGSRARKKRRNIFLTIGFIIIFCIIYFILPTFQMNFNDPVPDENIIPDPVEDITSLASTIEELELSLFQKDQKIKFRDGQIINLQNSLKERKLELDQNILELSEIKKKYNILLTNNDSPSSNEIESLQENFNKINIENNNNITKIKNLNKTIEEFENKILLLEENQKIISNENSILKKDNKILFSKNLKFSQNISNLEKKINEQNNQIEFYLEEINKLKDKSHHGG